MRAIVAVLLAAVLAIGLVVWFSTGDDPFGPGPKPVPGDGPDAAPLTQVEPPVPPVAPPAMLVPLGRGVLRVQVERDGSPTQAVVHVHPIHRSRYRTSDALLPSKIPEPWTSSTDSSGRVEFRGLDGAGLHIRAVAPDGAIGEKTLPFGPENKVIVIGLAPARETLFGTACYSDGRPFRGGVRLENHSPKETLPDGSFRFMGLLPGVVTLVFSDRKSLLVTRKVEIPRVESLLVVMDRGFAMLEGDVLAADNREPVAGAAVCLYAAGAILTTTADPNGRFRVEAPNEVDIGAQVTAAGFAPQRLHLRRGGPIEILMLRRCRLAGRVIDRAGNPVVGVPVLAKNRRYPEDGVARVDSGADGRFEFTGVGPGNAEVTVRGEGWVGEGMTRRVSWNINPDLVAVRPDRRTEVEIVAVRAGRVEGTVRQPDGSPVAGVPVTIDTLPWWEGVRTTDTAVTDAAGHYAIGDLVPGFALRLTATLATGLPIVSGPIKLEPGETRHVNIDIEPPRWIDLTVIDADTRQPVWMAGVTVFHGVETAKMHFQTGRDGRAKLGPLPADRVEVRVDHGHYLCPSEAVAIEGDSKTIELRRGLYIAGRVVLPQGKAPERGHAWISGYESRYSTRLNARLDPKGSFRLGPLPAGTFEVAVAADGAHGSRKVGAGSEDLLFTISATSVNRETKDEEPDHGEMTIRWFGPDGTRAVSGWTHIHHPGATSSNEHALRKVQENEGEVRYRVLRPGATVYVEIWGAKTPRGDPLAAVVHGPVRVAKGAVEIQLGVDRRIAGRILGADGKAIAGLSIIAQRPPGKTSRASTGHSTARTDERGFFEITGLGDMDYDLVATAPPGYSPPEPMRVAAGETGVIIELARSAALVVRVLDPDGKPVDRARLVAVRQDGKGRPRRTYSRNGVAVFHRLVAEKGYTVRIAGVGDGLAWVGEWLRPGVEEVTARLAPGLNIHGRLDVPGGVNRFELYAQCNGLYVKGTVEPDGRFEIRGLTKGRWKVYLHAAAGRKNAWSGETEADAGTEATITLKPQ